MSSIRNWVVKFARDERGLETVEWGILAALIVTGLVATITTLGTQVKAKFVNLQAATT